MNGDPWWISGLRALAWWLPTGSPCWLVLVFKVYQG